MSTATLEMPDHVCEARTIPFPPVKLPPNYREIQREIDRHRELVSDGATQILTRARELVAKGWCQQSFRRTRLWLWKLYCPDGAMREAVTGDAVSCPMVPAYMDAVRRFSRAVGVPASTLCIHTWNDKKWRTKDQVLAAFDTAIANR